MQKGQKTGAALVGKSRKTLLSVGSGCGDEMLAEESFGGGKNKIGAEKGKKGGTHKMCPAVTRGGG